MKYLQQIMPTKICIISSPWTSHI